MIDDSFSRRIVGRSRALPCTFQQTMVDGGTECVSIRIDMSQIGILALVKSADHSSNFTG